MRNTNLQDWRINNMNIYFRRMACSDSVSVKQLIDKAIFHRSVQKVYEPSEVAAWDNIYTLEILVKIAEESHAYLLLDRDSETLLASGYIKLNEDRCSCHLGMIFTDPEFSNMGIGKKMISILEQDEYAKSTGKIELGSSLSAYRFYRKLGYVCKDNEYQIELDIPTNSYSVPMEKKIQHIGNESS